MTLNIGRAIKKATTVSSEMKKGWKSGKKTTTQKSEPKRKPKSRRNNPEMYPPTKTKDTDKVLKKMGLKPAHYWSKQFKNFKSK